MLTNLLFKMGVLALDGEVTSVWHYTSYFIQSLFVLIRNDYGISGLVMIYLAFYAAIRSRNLHTSENIAASTYLMLFVPCLAWHIFFAMETSHHPYASLRFGFSLSQQALLLHQYLFYRC